MPSFVIAGTWLPEHSDVIELECEQGDALELKREPQNSYDANAIAVFKSGGDSGMTYIDDLLLLGYVPAELAKELAVDMDAGATVIARIKQISAPPGGSEAPEVLVTYVADRSWLPLDANEFRALRIPTSQWKYGGKAAEVRSASGVEGVLCRTLDGDYFFRIYQKGQFRDFDLRHSDLKVRITDGDASFYEHEKFRLLDHSPEVLGLEKIEDTDEKSTDAESTTAVEWEFGFCLSSRESGKPVGSELSNALMDTIIEFAENNELIVGGGFGPYPSDAVRS